MVYFNICLYILLLVAQMVKDSPARQEPWVLSLRGEDSPGEGNSYPLQNAGLENPMDRGAWWVTFYGVQRVERD